MSARIIDIRRLAARSGLTVEETLSGLADAEQQGWLRVTDLGHHLYRIVPTVPAHLYCEYLKMSGGHP